MGIESKSRGLWYSCHIRCEIDITRQVTTACAVYVRLAHEKETVLQGILFVTIIRFQSRIAPGVRRDSQLGSRNVFK